MPVVLTNTSSRTCQVAGYPGVSLLDASGAQIGSPATRDPGTVAAITLKPGATASTAMHTINPGIASGGCWPASAKVKVFPPNELNALTLGGKLTVCASRFSITPLVAGTSGAPG